MGVGDKLIRFEAFVLGIAVFIIALVQMGWGIAAALVSGIVVAFVFPWLTGLIEVFAWFVAIVFSFIWAVIAYFIGGALLGDSAIAGILVAILVFVISFFLHKVFAGLGYSSVEKHIIDTGDQIQRNTMPINQNVNDVIQVQSIFCQACGAKLKAEAKFCGNCGRAQ